MRCLRISVSIITFIFFFFFFSTVYATQFNLTKDQLEDGYQSFGGIGLDELVFGFSKTGQAQVDINITSGVSNNIITMCDVSDLIDRGFTLQRRHPKTSYTDFRKEISTRSCNSDINRDASNNDPIQLSTAGCVGTNLNPGFNSIVFNANTITQNGLYALSYIFCNIEDKTRVENQTFTGSASLTNLNTLYPHLGYDEFLFPIIGAIVTALNSTYILILIIGLILIKTWNLELRPALPLVLSATVLKGIVAAVVFSFFWNLQQTGRHFAWYPYFRVAFTCIADVALVTVAVAMSSGFVVMPDTWFTNGRSPMILAYVCITLQVVIVVVLKLFYIHQGLDIVCFIMCGGCLALILASSSHSNYNFCKRYSVLVEDSHIVLKSTPVKRMQRFFLINSLVLITSYITQVIVVIVTDLFVARPDLMWGLMEIVDAIVLGWYTLSVFPRKESALYVDMSNISNERLQRAQLWRAAQARLRQEQAIRNGVSTDTERGRPSSSLASTNGPPTSALVHPSSDAAMSDMENGPTEQRRPITSDTPQPPWIEWTSGMVLPRPDGATWGRPLANVLNRDQRLPHILQETIVIGSTEDNPDKLNLTIGVPSVGPESVPRMIDEKGRIVRIKEPRRRTIDFISPITEAGSLLSTRTQGTGGSRSRIELGKRLRQRLRIADRNAAGSSDQPEQNQDRQESTEWRATESESMSTTTDGRHDIERRFSVGSSVASHDGYLYKRTETGSSKRLGVD